MTEPLTSCSHGHNWRLGNPLGEASSIINRRLDVERDIRYWNRDIDEWDDEPYPEETENEQYDDYEPVEMPNDEPEEPMSPLGPQARGSASKRNKVKLTKNGGANLDWD